MSECPLRTDPLLRPVFHRLEHHVRAHVLICWLALLLTRVAERGTGPSWRNTNRQLGRITQAPLTGPAGTLTQTSPLKPKQGHLPGTYYQPTGPEPGSGTAVWPPLT
jgi:hypothetical protein